MTRSYGFATLLPLAMAALVCISPSLLHAQVSDDDAKKKTDRVVAAFCLGLGPVAVKRESFAKFAYGPGLLAEVQLGGAVTNLYATGLGLRGGWSLPVEITPEGSAQSFDDPQLLQGSLYWFQQFATKSGSSFRVSLGPHLTQLLIDGEAGESDPLVGGEVGLEYRLSRFRLTPTWSSNWWFGAFASHAFGVRAQDHVPDNDRETVLKLAISFALERGPKGPEARAW